MKNITIYSLFLALIMLSCDEEQAVIEINETYKKDLANYVNDRDDGRRNGYLKLCGLFKMNDSLDTFGKDSTNSIVLDLDGLAPTIGSFTFRDDEVTFTASEGVEVKTDKDSLITSVVSSLGPYGSDLQLFHDRIKYQVISRSGQNYLRVWDEENPAIAAFKGFEWYPINPNMIFEGDFIYYPKPKESKVKSQLGVKASTNFIGRIRFDHQGKTHDLEVGENGFTMVADATTGDKTYGGGRYIYLTLPKTDSIAIIDFNKLYNPPCSFSEYTTCLYPPLQNMLPFKIEAGETITLKD